MSKVRKLLLIGGVSLVIIFLTGFLIVSKINSDSLKFFEAGSSIVRSLHGYGKALNDKDAKAVEIWFSSEYKGSQLGLNQLVERRKIDGVKELDFTPDSSTLNRQEAINEWFKYLDGFDSIQEIGLHVHRLEQWKSSNQLVASIRFELIGIPKGSTRPGADRALIRMRFLPGENPILIGAELIEGGRTISDKPHFVNVADSAGIAFENQFYPGFMQQDLKFGMIMYGPGGISASDYDNDGLYDLFIPDGVYSRLFRNLGDGAFEDTTEKAGLGGLDGVSVGLFADYDNDGHKDFFVSRTFNPNQLFHNNGDGTFTDVTSRSGIGEDCCTTVASWADYNNDGFLDLYVGRYLDPRLDIPTTFYARNGEPNTLYRNNGDGTFTDVTREAGVGETGLCLGTVFGDYNDDGYPDLYVVNDFGRNTLYRNLQNGTFEDVTTASGTLAYGAGMNASIGDYDNDGKLDIYVTNIRSDHAWFAEAPTIHRYMFNSFAQGVWLTDMPLYMEIFRQSGFGFTGVFQQMASGNTLLKNKGDGSFEDVTWESAANPPGWFWGAAMADFDNDGWKDIYAANGWVYNDPGTEIELQFLNNVVSKQDQYKTGLFFDPNHFGTTSWHGWERNRMLRNNADGTFLEIGTPSGTDLLVNSRGVAYADYWNRGVLDIAVAASTDKHALLKNQIENGGNWVAFELVGTQSNRDAVGARVTIRSGSQQQTREVVLGDGYGSQNSLRLYFGLGKSETIDEVKVKWPASGLENSFTRVSANRILEVTEGSDQLLEKIYTTGDK